MWDETMKPNTITDAVEVHSPGFRAGLLKAAEMAEAQAAEFAAAADRTGHWQHYGGRFAVLREFAASLRAKSGE